MTPIFVLTELSYKILASSASIRKFMSTFLTVCISISATTSPLSQS